MKKFVILVSDRGTKKSIKEFVILVSHRGTKKSMKKFVILVSDRGTKKHFGFNESFIIWVKTVYSNIQTCVMNNGWISEIFKNSRGIRQVVLYLLCYLFYQLKSWLFE